MNENKYTRTVDSIHAPEEAVQTMLDTVRANEKKEKNKNMRLIRGYVIAAALAVVVFVGGMFGYNAMKPKNHIFSLTANASELTEREFTPICTLNTIGGEYYANREAGTVALKEIFQVNISVAGENVTNVTFAGENVAIEELREGTGNAQMRLLGLGITADSADETLPAETRQAILDLYDYGNTKFEDPTIQPDFNAAGFNQNDARTAIYTALLDRLTLTVSVTFSDGQIGSKNVVFHCDGVDPETGLMTISAKLK